MQCDVGGIFSLAKLEPREGVFNFARWILSSINCMPPAFMFLATPSGASGVDVAALSAGSAGGAIGAALHGGRHNHCMSSPVYREKTLQINTLLAERYSSHPAVLGWHISNEYGGECHCDLCQNRFRDWLKARYQTPENLNRARGAPSGVIPILTGRRLNRLRRRARCRSTVSILTGIALTPLR